MGGSSLTIEHSKLMGFASERIFACRLDTPHGESILAWLTRNAEPGSLAATPLGAAVEFVKNAGSVAELRELCAGLMDPR
jgi:hypothetical protein